MLSMICDYLMGPTLFLSTEWNCNLLTTNFRDTMSAWKMLSSLLEIWEYLYERESSVNFGFSKTVPHPRRVAPELLTDLSSVFKFTNIIIFCRKSIYETKLGKTPDNILEIVNSDRLITKLLLHFFYPSKELVIYIKEKEAENERKQSKNLSRADSSESVASSYVSTTSIDQSETEFPGTNQKSAEVVFSFDDVQIKSTKVTSSVQEEEEVEESGNVDIGKESELERATIWKGEGTGIHDEEEEKRSTVVLNHELKKVPNEILTTTKMNRKVSDTYGEPKTRRTLAKAQSYTQLPVTSERDKELIDLRRTSGWRSSVSLRLVSTTAFNVRLPYCESSDQLSSRKKRNSVNKNSLRRKNSDSISVDSFMTNGGYFTPGVSPVVQEDEISYMRLYPIFKKFHQRTSKMNQLTIFLRKGTRGEFVPFNLLTWKLANSCIELALLYRTAKQLSLNTHACAMSRLISAFKDILTGSFPHENKFSLSFDAVYDDVKTILDLNKGMPKFSKNVTNMWDKISDYIIPDEGETCPMMIQDFLGNYFPGSAENLPKLDSRLGENISKFLVLLQNQYRFYFCPEKLGFLIKDTDVFASEIDDLKTVVDSVLRPVKKRGKLSHTNIAPRMYIEREALNSSTFVHFFGRAPLPPGLVKFVFMNWTSGYNIDYPSRQDQKFVNARCSLFPKGMLQIWEYNRALAFSGYSAACWKFKQFWCIYTTSIRGSSTQPKHKHIRMSAKRAQKIFCDRSQSMMNCNVRRYLESILGSGPQSDGGFKTILELHTVFLDVLPAIHALKQHESLLEMMLNCPKLAL